MNQYDWNRRGGIRMLRLPTWQIALIIVLALSIGVAIALVATGILLIALPVAFIAALAYRLFGKRRTGRDGSVIEGEYEVIDAEPAKQAYRPRR